MWGTLFKQAAKLAQEGYSREEVREILKRAAELQAQAEQQKEQAGGEQIRHDALRAGAIAAGIRPEFLERALQEFHAKKQSQRQESKRGGINWGKLIGWLAVGIFGFPIALFVLGVLAFTFGTVLSVLLTVGLALGIAGIVLLMMSPFVGVGMLVGLATMIGHMLGQFKGRKWKQKRYRHRWHDEDDD